MTESPTKLQPVVFLDASEYLDDVSSPTLSPNSKHAPSSSPTSTAFNRDNPSLTPRPPTLALKTPSSATFDGLQEQQGGQKPLEGEDYARLDELDEFDGVEDTGSEDGEIRIVEHQTTASTILTASLNFTNSIIGAGIIGLPYAIQQAGWLLGGGLICLVTYLTSWTVQLLVKNGKLSGKHSYQDLIYSCFGPFGFFATSIFQFLVAFGGMCAYMIIIGDTFPMIFRRLLPAAASPDHGFLHGVTSRGFQITVSTIMVFFPLSLTREIGKLGKTSLVSLVAVVFIVTSVVFEGLTVGEEERGPTPTLGDAVHGHFLEAIGVISFAFVCHHNTFLIFNSLKTPTLDRFGQVTRLSTTIAMVSCLLMGLGGYAAFTDQVQGNVLNNFGADRPLVNLARFFFAVNMFTTYPMELLVAREVIEKMFYQDQPVPPRLNAVLTAVLVAASYAVAMLTCDLGIVLELGGTIAASALAYVLPPLCYIKLASGPAFSRKKLPHWILAAFGLSVMLLGTIMALNKSAKSNQCST